LEQITRGLVGRGINPVEAKQQALVLLDHQIQAQASVLAFSRIYILSGVILLAAVPLLFLFKTGKGRGTAGLAH
jgi:DHA2 family multidrug resistance protein